MKLYAATPRMDKGEYSNSQQRTAANKEQREWK